MFQSITIGRQDKSGLAAPLDIGYLLECLLFYGTVFVAADSAVLKFLIDVFGIDLLEELLDAECLKILYRESHIAIITTKEGGVDLHNAALMSAPSQSLHNCLKSVVTAKVGKAGKGRRVALRLEKRISPFHYDADVPSSAMRVLLDSKFTQEAAQTIVTHLVPGLPTMPIGFFCEQTEKGIIVHSNVDFDRLNDAYHRRIPKEHSSISVGLILAHICETEGHLYTAARQLSELAVDPIGSTLISRRFVHLANRSRKGEQARESFSELVLKDAKTIREAFNQKKIPIGDVVKVILAASRFKGWLSKHDVDANILQEYYREVTKGSFIESLPVKTTRWLFFLGLGELSDTVFSSGLGKPLGVAIGMVDTFLLDRLLKGWKPNQFISDQLQPLLQNREDSVDN